MARVTERVTARTCGAEPVHAAPVRDRRPDSHARPRLRWPRLSRPRQGRVARPPRARGRAAARRAAGGGRDRAGAARAETRAASAASGSRSSPARRWRTSRCDRGAAAGRTWGERTAAWAGTVADEIKVGGSANPDLVPVVRRMGGRAGRTRSSSGCVTVVDEDGAGRASARVPRSRRTSRSSPARPHARAAAGAGAAARPLRDRRHAGGGRGRGSCAVGGRRRPRRARDAAGPHDAGGCPADLRARAPAAALSRGELQPLSRVWRSAPQPAGDRPMKRPRPISPSGSCSPRAARSNARRDSAAEKSSSSIRSAGVSTPAGEATIRTEAPRGACPFRRRRRAGCARTGCGRGSAGSAARPRRRRP